VFLNQLGTQPQDDSSKNDLDTSEQEKGTRQPKINIPMTELSANIDPSPTSPSRIKTPSTDEEKQKAKSPEHRGNSPAKELREPYMEHLYTMGSLGNTLLWGDQQILELVDEIVDIQVIAYEWKRKAMMRRTIKKRKLTLNSTLFITTKDTLFDTESAKMTELIRAGMDINDAALDRKKKDEREVASMKKELEHLRNQVEYYQNSTQEVVLLKCDFREMYAQFTRERYLFTTHIANFQEDTLMGMETYKYMQRWHEKAH
jgi:hypothetical protein